MTNIEHLQIQELNRIPLYEPFRHLDHYYSLFNSISFDDISRFGEKVADSLRSDQINLSIFAILIRLSSQNLIDNFSFIYLVNRLAGRNSDNLSSNIIYPIIKNRVLDLPVQCQLAEKYNQILQKQLQIEQINPLSIIKTIKFFNMQVSLHGTFSSNPASSLYYLYRMQPYASALIDLQNGQFDAPDRMFYDYEALYKVIFWTNFKEHIPQLYTNIELYYNLHHFDLGIRSDKQKLNHVVFNNIESILQIQQQDIGEIQDTQVLQSFLIDDEQDQIVESISQTVQDNSLVQLIPVLNAEQHLDLISNREQQVENPINALQCIFELYENLEIVQKANLFRWLSLYFGPNQFSRQNFTQYSPATYLLRVQSQQLCQEFDQAKYFGAIPNKLFDCRFQQPDTKQYLLLSNKFVLKDQFLTINLITHMQKLMQGTEARKLFEPATFLPAGYQRNINFITRFTTNFLTFCNFDLVPFKTQIFDIPILQQTATAALLGLRFEGTVKLYQIKSNRIHFSHEIPLATTSICLSPSQILLVLTAYKIYAFDALNHCVLAQCDFAGGLQIQTDAWDNVYVRALACVHVFGPELARLGSIPIGEDERFVPFERMRLVVYGRNWLKMVVLSAAAADNFEVSEPSPGPYFAIPNGYEALNCEALNGCELADRIVSCGSLEVGCQQEFVFNEQIVGVEVLKFSVLVKCEVSDFSIIAD
ncbi:Beige/BEACH domain-containing protein [Spironucleus salmonicida]|nr:Beige/BEACH domain-containing protein [Spironucleus salmonicida]